MGRSLQEALERIKAAVLDDAVLVRAVGSGRRHGRRPAYRRVELRYVDIAAGRRLQITAYDDQQAHTRNLAPGAASEQALCELLAEPFGNWHLDTVTQSTQLRVTKRGEARVHTAERVRDLDAAHRHDRAKPRLLDPADPVLRVVGIADQQGRIKPSRQAKYRQVEEFLRSLDLAVSAALEAGTLPTTTAQRPLRVADLGCGNAYLTFASYAYLSGRGLAVRMLGVDVRQQSLTRNTALATELGWADLTFAQGSIADADPTGPLGGAPDVVLALHACDTATDEALARAVGWRSPVVLAAPCCHHDLQVQLSRRPAPSPFGLVTRHGILAERLADVLTDAARAAILRQRGYRVDVLQFVEAGDTPRNVLLRAVRTDAPPSPEVRREYDDLVATWGVQPALARMLAASATGPRG